MIKYYTALIFLVIFSMIIMIAIIESNNNLKKNKKKGFIGAYSLLIVVAVCEYLGCILDFAPSTFRELHLFIKFIELSLTPIIPTLCGSTIFKQRKINRTIIIILLLINAVIEFSSIFNGLIFTVTASNQYKHSEFYIFYIFACLLSVGFLFYVAFKFSKIYQNRNSHILILIMCLLLIGSGIQFWDPEIKITWIAVAIGSIFIYVYYNELIQYIDGLTKLLNQRSYKNYCSNLNNNAVIILFDVDDFKPINDILGHQVGDKYLIEIADLIKNVYGKYGKCFRIGGDEFCVITNSDLDNIRDINDCFFSMLEGMQKIDKNLPYVSLGYAVFNPDYDVLSDIISEADKNMYKIKEWSKKNKQNNPE